MSFDWRSLIGQVAPVIGTALGGPLAGMAVKAVGDAIGLQNATPDTVSVALANATPDQLAAIKKADQDFAAKMKELDINLEQIDASDRANARTMQTNLRSNVPAMLAGLITTGFFGILIGMLAGYLTSKDSPELNILIGALSTAWGMVVSFYYGSSAQSHIQTRILGEKANK